MDKNSLPVLIVEDDDALREALAETLELDGFSTLQAPDPLVALAMLGSESVGLVLSDVQMGSMDGHQLMEEIKRCFPWMPVVLMTAYPVLERAVGAMQQGASHYLGKPFSPEELATIVRRFLLPCSNGQVLAKSDVMQQVLSMARRAALADISILLTGESGVGKEVLARFIHMNSTRAQGPFVAVNCAAIPDNLLESTLFGHEKGAFTGANTQHLGKFEQAQKGVLLLDEITEMPLSLQAKLLRVLQEREVERVGGIKPIPLDVRVLATSNRDLAAAVKSGLFREDLFYRLNVLPIHVPPLRERRADIEDLARNLLSRHGERLGKPGAFLSDRALHSLMAWDWPGNVRELENVIQRGLVLAPASQIEPEHLGLPLAANLAAELPVLDPEQMDLKTLEKHHILEALKASGGVRKLAAERLNMSERTLRYKLAQYREEEGGLPL